MPNTGAELGTAASVGYQSTNCERGSWKTSKVVHELRSALASLYSRYNPQPARPMLDILRELWSFLRVRKKYWLMPIVLVLVAIGGILVAVKGSVIAPFIYTLF